MATGNTYIHSLVWIDGPIKAILQSDTKDRHLLTTAYFYIYTNEATNSSGLFRMRIANMADDLGITKSQAMEVMAGLSEYQLVEYDHDAGVVWVIDKCRAVFKKIVKSDNRAKEVKRTLDNLPKTQLKRHFLTQYPEFSEESSKELEGASKGLARGFEGASKSTSRSGSESASPDPDPRPTLPDTTAAPATCSVDSGFEVELTTWESGQGGAA